MTVGYLPTNYSAVRVIQTAQLTPSALVPSLLLSAE